MEQWIGEFGPDEQIIGVSYQQMAGEPGASTAWPFTEPHPGPQLAASEWAAARRHSGNRGPIEYVAWWERKAG